MEAAPALEFLRQALAGPGGRQAALSALVNHLGCDSGTLHLLGPDGMLHLAAATAGIPEAVLAAVQVVPVGKGLAGLAVERREPVTLCNLQTDTSGAARPGAKATGMQGAIVVPCLRGAEVLGALGVANRREREFNAAEIELLSSAGSLLAAR